MCAKYTQCVLGVQCATLTCQAGCGSCIMMMMKCNTRVITLSVNMHCAENKYGMWMVFGSNTPPDEGANILPPPACTTASSGKCFINTFTKIHELKTVFKLSLREPHLLEIKLSLQLSLVADSSPRHGSLLMVNCSWLDTQDTRIVKN